MARPGTQVTFRMVRNRFPAVIAEVNAKAEAVQKKAKEMLAERARQTVRVRSGATKDSIEVTTEGVEAGEAAPYLEFGTVNMPAYPFLGPAAGALKEEFGLMFAELFKGIAPV